MFQKILVGADLTEASQAVLERALQLAQPLGSAVTVVHVMEAPFEPHRWFTPFSESDTAFVKNLGERNQRAAEIKLAAELKKIEGAQGIKVATVVRSGLAADVIVEVANEIHADLIVIGTHGRRGLRHLALGSVAEHVLRQASCAVMTVHSDGKA